MLLKKILNSILALTALRTEVRSGYELSCVWIPGNIWKVELSNGVSTKVSSILVLSQKHFIKTWICGSKGFWGKCPSLPEKMLIPSCLDQISGFSPSGISPPRRKNFCLHFLNRNHLYLNSGSLTFSPLTFVSRQTLYKHNCAFCTASQRLISSLVFFAFKTCFFFGRGTRIQATWTGLDTGSLQELWQRPVLAQLAAEIEYGWSDHWAWSKGR